MIRDLTTDDYEARRINRANWVATKVEGIDLDEAGRTGFMRLFDYISGANARSQKIEVSSLTRSFVR